MQKQRQQLKFISIVIVTVIAIFVAMAVSCCLGSADIKLRDIILYFAGASRALPKSTVVILSKVRIPRILMAVITGGTLAVVGSAMQGIFKNSMADPSVLGISSGSALGAAVFIVLGLDGVIMGIEGLSGIYLGAMAGAIITWLIVFTIAKQGGEYDLNSTLLAGIAISSILSALLTLLMTVHRDNLERIYMWTLGSFSNSTKTEVIVLLIALVICGGGLLFIAPQIDILKLGKESALSLGVKSSKVTALAMAFSSILLACAVAASGIIGFVGLIIPHIAAFFGARKMREKMILSFLFGALFMLVCDTLARTVIAPAEIAIGALTSLIGAPYFLYLLLKNRPVGEKRGKV